MGIEKDLEKALEEDYWIDLFLKSGNLFYGKISNIDSEGGIIRLCPYHYFITPFGKEDNFYFERVEDKVAVLKISEIISLFPIPSKALELIEKTAGEIITSYKKKAGF